MEVKTPLEEERALHRWWWSAVPWPWRKVSSELYPGGVPPEKTPTDLKPDDETALRCQWKARLQKLLSAYPRPRWNLQPACHVGIYGGS